MIAYAVSQRTREIGIRMALGAEHGGLRRMFVRDGLVLARIGSAIGLAGAAALDPATYAAVCLFLIASAAVASYIPARKASTVDPIEALPAD